MGAKAAETLWLELSMTVQVAPVPVQAPPQPENPEPPPGVAVSVTWVPLLKVAEQVVGQLIPAGVLVTVPLAPEAEMVTCKELVPTWVGPLLTPRQPTAKAMARLQVESNSRRVPDDLILDTAHYSSKFLTAVLGW